MMCALTAGQRGKKILLIDHAKKIGEKIRISGGGRCNFTNLHTRPEAFLSHNAHFCKSALAQYTQHDFIAMIDNAGISYHEKDNGEKYGFERKLGQLFCDNSAQDIIDMLLNACDQANVTLMKETAVEKIDDAQNLYHIKTTRGSFESPALVIASGGLSIPKIGASPYGYEVAKQFGLDLIPSRPALVPLTFTDDMLSFCKSLSGLSLDASVSYKNTVFREGLLFTHRGLSGPSILQISSYWNEGEAITINLAPDHDIYEILLNHKNTHPKREIHTLIADIIPARLADAICNALGLQGRIADLSNAALKQCAGHINHWHIKPAGTEGYRTAEVTIGGVNTNALSSKTMEVKTQKGLYFIGEVVDVTGHLGGYNFQWAWSSGYVAGMNV